MKSVPGMHGKMFRTPLGKFRLCVTEKGLFSLDWGRGGTVKYGRPSRAQSVLTEKTCRMIQRYLKGGRVEFRNLPVDWRGYPPFSRKVLQELRKTGWGRTQTYQDLSRKAGRPKGARAVGQVLGRNRLPIVVPCHRVLPKGGGLGGFSRGVPAKAALLRLEKAALIKEIKPGRPV